MKTIGTLLSILLVYVFALNAEGQPTYDQRLYSSFITGNMTDWVKVLNEMELDLQKNLTPQNRFNLLHAQYGYIGYLLGLKQTDKAKKLIDLAEKNAEQLQRVTAYKSTAYALHAALIAYRISISPFKAPFLGPKSSSLIDQALAISPNNAFAIIEKANARHYAPSVVGGNPVEAIELYDKALKLLRDANGGEHPKTWWYINAYTQMGIAAQKSGNRTLAKKIYQNILSFEPNYKWVKEELLPKVKS